MLKYADVLVITETKLNGIFLTFWFLVTGFSVPYRLDQNKNRGDMMIFIRDDIRSRLITKHVFPGDIEGYLFSLILETFSGYYLERITDHLKVTHIISII